MTNWTQDRLEGVRETWGLLNAGEAAEVVAFMLTRPRGMTIRYVILLPTNFEL